MKILRGFTTLALALCLAAGTATAAQEGGEEPGDGWTDDYECVPKFLGNEHKLEDEGNDAGGGVHPFWPGDCTPHYVA